MASLFVTRPNRGQGLGRVLLAAAEEELARRGARQVRLEYHTDMPAHPALERLLRGRGWAEPRAVMLRCRGDSRVLEAPFFQPPQFARLQGLLRGVKVFPWDALTPDERAGLLAQQGAPGSWVPAPLSPFQEDPHYERSVCLGLRFCGEVVGWLITHRLTPTVARYTWGYVRPDVARRGAFLLLVREAAVRHLRALPSGFQVLWTVPLWAGEMARFVRVRLAPWLCSMAEVRETYQVFSS
jgi:hypothetical protein